MTGRLHGSRRVAGGVVARRHRHEESNGTRRGAAFVARAARFLTLLPNADAVLQAALDECMDEIHGIRGLICLLNPATGVLEVRFTSGAGWAAGSDLSLFEVKDAPGGGIIGHVAATAHPYYSPDVSIDPYYVCHWPDVRSELGLPLLDTNGNALGVLLVEGDRSDAFCENDRTFAAALAEAASAALSMADYRAREKALIEVGKELSSIADINDLMQKVVDLGASLLRAQDCTLLLIGDDHAHVILAASYGPLRSRAGQAIYRVGEGLTGWVAEFGQPVRLKDVRDDPRWKGVHLELPAEGIGAFMAVPVNGSKGTLGVLRVLRRKRKYIGISQAFTRSDQDLLQTLASQVGVALENCQLVERVLRSERLATWGEMSARAAHMIGNRVFAIKGSLNELNYLLGHEPQSIEGVRELVGNVSQGITRLEEILREFRDFVTATKLQTSIQDVNILIREALAECFPRGSKVRLDLNLDAEAPRIVADPQRMHRAISELIENAVDLQPDGGFLEFRTRRMPADEPRDISAHLPSGELVVVSVRDGGPGIPSELKQRIFLPFFSTRARGMGLGLSIVSGIVQAHRGIIREVGIPGEGAHFEIFLPLASSHRSTTEA